VSDQTVLLAPIELKGLLEATHHRSDMIDEFSLEEEVKVVGHQAEMIAAAGDLLFESSQEVKVMSIIRVRPKDGHSVVASSQDVVNAGGAWLSGKSGHNLESN